jgi:hypothetical protein
MVEHFFRSLSYGGHAAPENQGQKRPPPRDLFKAFGRTLRRRFASRATRCRLRKGTVMNVVILDTGCANLNSVKSAVSRHGYAPAVSRDPDVVLRR